MRCDFGAVITTGQMLCADMEWNATGGVLVRSCLK